ncbi:MAG: hypothetical protein GY711_34430 [bacterium]|nr:hypothetical protein [bacterium]
MRRDFHGKRVRAEKGSYRRGNALVASLLLVIVIAGLGAGIIQVQSAIERRHAESIDRKRALYMAETGLSEAFHAVASGKSGNVGTPLVPASFADGLYWVEATELGNDRVALVSTGMCGTGRFTLSMSVQSHVNRVGMLGFFGADGITVEPGCTIGSCDSRDLSWDPQLVGTLDPSAGPGTRLTTNGDAVLDDVRSGPETAVHGDILAGPTGSVVVGTGANVSGSMTPSLASVELRPIEPPLVQSAGNLQHTSGGLLVLGTPRMAYGDLEVGKDSTLLIQGPASLVVDTLELSSGAELRFDSSSGPIRLYCSQSFVADSGSILSSASGDPRGVALILGDLQSTPTRPDLVFEASGEFFGMLIAPTEDISLPSSLTVVGSAAAKSLNVESGTRVLFDEAVTRGGFGVGVPRLLSWEIRELPDTGLVRTRIDASTILQLRGVTPTPSWSAQREQRMQISYTDGGGITRTYDGNASDFTWAHAESIESFTWIDPDTDAATGRAPSNLAELNR